MSDNIKIEIGKYTLESLTTGMYAEPKIVYREYIQNSVDSLEEAVGKHVVDKQNMRIDIIINSEEGKISIRDNGTGISKDKAISTLLDIGNSQKRHTNSRGFRGIGRLGGMSYCNNLLFSTSAKGEMEKTVIIFDCKKLRDLLIPGQYSDYDLQKIIEEITTIYYEDEIEDKHYFLVEMEGVNDFSDLLSINDVRNYISQVAPLPYNDRLFVWSSEVRKNLLLKDYYLDEFPVFIGNDETDLAPVYKPNKHRFNSDRLKKKKDDISKIIFFDVEHNNEILATGWYGDCNWYGTITDLELSGLRVRKGNILIGDSKTLSSIFREQRFNGWVQGEIFVLSDKLIPNARRDDFEQKEEYDVFLKILADTVGNDISKTIREASNMRNNPSSRILNEVMQKIDNALTAFSEGFNSGIDKRKMLADLKKGEHALEKVKDGADLGLKKEAVLEKIRDTEDIIEGCSNFKINKINSGLDRKSKQVLIVVSDILSLKLSKFLVDEILEEIIAALNKK